MRSLWELARLNTAQRKELQVNPVRKMMIGAYAPCEPAVMDGIFSFLDSEKKYPLKTIHKIMDRFASMTINTTVMTYEEVVDFVKGIPDDFKIAKGPCACRLHTAEDLGPDAIDIEAGELDFCQQSPLNVDIQIATCAEKFGSLDTYEYITKDELLRLEKECHNMGLVPNVYMMFGGDAGICHCSSATCVPFIANRAIKGKSSVIKRGQYLASTDSKQCDGTGYCAKVCHFGARSFVPENGVGKLHVNKALCYGCGLCAVVCPQNAITMVSRF
ncbi:MAG: 4Fe-4S dicluster domain-containing protein [Desulfatibacillum sp.]|nr:4Fe-4S dicluster domain-containing protein [Desulfatibacillum sp.]